MRRISPRRKQQISTKNSWAENCKNRCFELKKRYALFDPIYAHFIHPDLTTFLLKTEASRCFRDECCYAGSVNDHYVKSGHF